jgi:hypothetical protein
MTDCVWIVNESCRYEGGAIHSVHATHESALAAAEELRQQRNGPWFAATDNTDVFLWRNGMNYIVIRKWSVTTKEKP